MPPAPPGGDARGASGLVGGIFSKRDHDGIRVKFTDVDWATIVRAGGVTQSEVSSPPVMWVYCLPWYSVPRSLFQQRNIDATLRWWF